MKKGNWGDTGLYPTIFSIDARSFVPLFALFVHWDTTLLWLSFAFMIMSAFMLYYHISYEDMFRIIRRTLTGKHRYRYNHKYKNTTRNY